LIDSKIATATRALARYGSFREAAQAIGTSAASFSRHISQAETFAGLTLFERRRNGAQVTSAGQEFLRLLDALDTANGVFEQGVEQLGTTGASTLNIGCGPLTTRTIIAPLLKQLLKEMPELRIRVTVSATKEPLEALRRGTLDVAICDLTHTPDLDDLDLQVVEKRPVSFWARPQHPLHGTGSISLADVFRQPIVAPYFHRHWRVAVEEILGGDQAARQIVEHVPKIECDDYGLLLDLACESDLICGGMRDAAAHHEALGLLVELKTTQDLSWNICAARRANTSFPALNTFWTILTDQFSQ
jgi:DNA-binding transcriptional LysR family regulator